MKNIDETVSTVFDRMATYRAKQQKKNKIIMCTVIPLGCVCLIGALSFGLWKQPTTPNQPQYIQATLPQAEQPFAEPSEPTQTDAVIQNENKIVIHRIESVPESKQDICLLWDDFVAMSQEEVAEYYGINVFPTIPSDILEWEEQNFGIFKRNGGTGEVYHDVNILNYDNEDFTRSVNIEVSKGRLPFTCIVVPFDIIQEKSVINGTEVAIVLSDNGYYHVEFMYKNVGFRLIALGISEEELVSIISSIIQ